MINFVGRIDELEILDELWGTNTSSLLILYGRRRVGKTRLLTHWLQNHQNSGLYWVAEPTSKYAQLRSFSQALYNFTSPILSAPSDFTYSSWEQVFNEIVRISQTKKIAIFIDELGYIIDADPEFPGTLQKAWDNLLKNENVMLALSGSQMSVIQSMIDYKGPLYGRATAAIQLQPLPYSATRKYFSKLTPTERVHIYAIWGGIPAYWELLDGEGDLRKNIKHSFLRSNMLMQQEPSLLLQDFMSDPHNYMSMMQAMANGKYTRGKIARFTGLPEGHMSKYINVLRNTGFVKRFVPVTENPKVSRRGHYKITDPLLRFYYRFLPKHNSRLALGAQDEILDDIESKLPTFIQENTWVELCREWVVLASHNKELPIAPLSENEIGGAWIGKTNISVVGYNAQKNEILFGCAIWEDVPASNSKIIALLEESKKILKKINAPIDGLKVFYVGFSSAGWDEEATSTVEQITNNMFVLEPWESLGIRLVNLSQLDEDLANWQTIY